MEISSGVDTPAQARARLFARLRIRDQEFACESDYVQAFEAALASETQGDANAMQPEAAAELLEKELVGEFVEVVFHIAVLGGDLLLAEVLKVVSVEPDAEHGVRYHCLVPSLGQDSCIEWIGPLTELRPAAIG